MAAEVEQVGKTEEPDFVEVHDRRKTKGDSSAAEMEQGAEVERR